MTQFLICHLEFTAFYGHNLALDPKKLEKLKESDCILVCDKQRNGEWEGKIALWFDKQSFQYLGKPNYKAKRFVEFSILNSVTKEQN